jgi:hypothetical protein
MSSIEEKLSEQFCQWELRGRGWHVFPEPVHPEPPFRPFYGHFLPDTPVVDDGRRPTFLSSLMEKLSRRLSDHPTETPPVSEPEEEPEPEILIRDSLIELQTSFPAKLDISKEAFEQFLRNLSFCHEPIAFEMLGTPGRVSVQFAANSDDAPIVRRQLQAYFPEATFQPREGSLTTAWESCQGEEILVVEFGLAREFMFSLECGKLDPFVGIVGALSELQQGELALFQVLFESVEQDWPESIVNSVTHEDGKPFFVNMPELAAAAENKVARPLYAAVVRIAVKSEMYERTVQIARELAASLRVFADPQGNELIPLTNDDYPFEEHIGDVLSRQSRRSGMLLNSDELIGFVHLPSSDIRSPALERDAGKTKAAPAIARSGTGIVLGNNTHIGETIPVRLTPEQRVRHIHTVGASGTGKSTLLFNLIRQDIENGEGLAVLDPHGDLVDKVLGIIPAKRIGDVVLLDPSDEEYSIGFNILSAHSDLEKNLLASDLVSVFERLSSTWGDQMQSVLQNAILAFLESSERGTLADVRRFLIEPAFRSEFLKSVKDPELLYYWQKGFPQLTGNKSIGPVITRIDAFLAPKPIRYMVSQTENRLDFGGIMDSGKIFLAKLPEGLLGKENSYLLGTLLVSKFQQLAMSRQAKQIAARRDFWIYIDEFHNFITPSMAVILSGARKYRIGLTLAHQELHQLERNRDVASAVLSNPYTRIVFRVGDSDAKRLADGFAFFESRDLQNLETGQAICRIEKADNDFNLAVPFPETVDPGQAEAIRQAVITASRAKYATPRAEVEAILLAKFQSQASEAREAKSKPIPPLPPIVLESKVSEVPKLAELPKPADPIPATATNLVGEPASAVQEPLRDLGRGGEQHKTIQERIQSEARALGFQAQIEQQLAEGSMQAADLVLRKDDFVLAVEISITTTVDHEFGNVKKCLAAGFPRVAVVSPKPEKLQAIKEALEAGLGAEGAANVSFHTPDELIEELKRIAAEAATKPLPPSIPAESTVRGYTVRRHKPVFTAEEQRAKEEMAHKVLVETMKQVR